MFQWNILKKNKKLSKNNKFVTNKIKMCFFVTVVSF